MQTVYLQTGCYKCYNALRKLYSYPDLSTNIIIVNKNQAKILLLDKRVNKFPFVINSLPTSIGLIPKIAKVLPLEMFMMLRKFNVKPSKNLPKEDRVIVIPSKTYNKKIIPKMNTIPKKIIPKLSTFSNRTKIPTNAKKTIPKKNNLIIKTRKETDGSINIILNK